MFKIICVIFAAIAVGSSSSVQRNGRIVGGGTVGAGDVPSMASVRTSTGEHLAGGVIIAQQWILTGAYSIIDRVASTLKVTVGSLNLSSGGIAYSVYQVYVYPQFNATTRQNDIACLFLSMPLTLNQNVLPINIHPGFIQPNVQAQVSGWGAVDSNMGDNSDDLKQLTVTTESCPSTSDDDRVPDDQINICARGSSETGFCTTDVGGPLIGSQGLIGIASWHPTQCAPVNDPPTTEGYPDVYVRITAFRQWISSVTGV